MKITKKQIEFFNSYISSDTTRPALRCLFLDMNAISEDRTRARLCATDGFCFGSLDVELSASDNTSYLIPYEHLVVAKNYLEKNDCVVVECLNDSIVYQTPKATITVDEFDTAHGLTFPAYEKVINKKREKEYTIKIDARLLKEVITSHIKLGRDNILITMSGANEPISFVGFDKNVTSILMPLRGIDDDELGKFQKDVIYSEKTK